MEQDQSNTLTRRKAVQVGATAAAGAVGVVTLAACGGSSSGTDDAAPSAAETTAAADGSGTAALAKLADVPVGGVVVVKDAAGAPLVLTQPTAGNLVAFSGKCTHAGCAVAADATAVLKCPCHGSTFDATGKPTAGPAKSPLAPVAVKVDGDNVVAG